MFYISEVFLNMRVFRDSVSLQMAVKTCYSSVRLAPHVLVIIVTFILQIFLPYMQISNHCGRSEKPNNAKQHVSIKSTLDINQLHFKVQLAIWRNRTSSLRSIPHSRRHNQLSFVSYSHPFNTSVPSFDNLADT